jgi:hypothetical protein
MTTLAVGFLIVLKDGYQGAANGNRGAVQRVEEAGL